MSTSKTITSNHPGFDFDISTCVRLELHQLWPDGDAHFSTRAATSSAVGLSGGGLRCVLRDWSLDDDIELTISGNGTIAMVRR